MTWLQTRGGKAFDLLAPHPDDVDILDITHALAHTCRFGGHCSRFYSVAEHSVLVSYVVPFEDALAGLMHDATEAYVVDVPRPLKLLLSNYAEIEARVAVVIAQKFGLGEMPPSVKLADNTVLLAERDALMLPPPYPWGWDVGLTAADVNIRGLPPGAAASLFLNRFVELTARVSTP